MEEGLFLQLGVIGYPPTQDQSLMYSELNSPSKVACWYRTGTAISKDNTFVCNDLSFHSTCRNRRWECTDRPCMGACVAYGDGHFVTFDGERYIFEGSCEYTLAQVCGPWPLPMSHHSLSFPPLILNCDQSLISSLLRTTVEAIPVLMGPFVLSLRMSLVEPREPPVPRPSRSLRRLEYICSQWGLLPSLGGSTPGSPAISYSQGQNSK